MSGIPWGYWPFTNCPGRSTHLHVTPCDLRRGHDGPHMADRGMYWVAWRDDTWAETNHPAEGAVNDMVATINAGEWVINHQAAGCAHARFLDEMGDDKRPVLFDVPTPLPWQPKADKNRLQEAITRLLRR